MSLLKDIESVWNTSVSDWSTGASYDLYCEVLPVSDSSVSVTFFLPGTSSLAVCKYGTKYTEVCTACMCMSLLVMCIQTEVLICEIPNLSVLVTVMHLCQVRCQLFAPLLVDAAMNDYISRVTTRYDHVCFTFFIKYMHYHPSME